MIAIVKLGLDLNIEIMTVAMILRNVSMMIGVFCTKMENVHNFENAFYSKEFHVRFLQEKRCRRLKAPLSQHRSALLCSKMEIQISHEN